MFSKTIFLRKKNIYATINITTPSSVFLIIRFKQDFLRISFIIFYLVHLYSFRLLFTTGEAACKQYKHSLKSHKKISKCPFIRRTALYEIVLHKFVIEGCPFKISACKFLAFIKQKKRMLYLNLWEKLGVSVGQGKRSA